MLGDVGPKVKRPMGNLALAWVHRIGRLTAFIADSVPVFLKGQAFSPAILNQMLALLTQLYDRITEYAADANEEARQEIHDFCEKLTELIAPGLAYLSQAQQLEYREILNEVEAVRRRI